MKRKIKWRNRLLIWLLLIMMITVLVVVIKKNQSELGETKVQFYEVIRVVDGDTVEVEIENIREVVRLIGIDAPEENLNGKKECLADEATARVKELVEARVLKLESDPTQDDRDKYGRLLRYVFVDDGKNVNKLMIEGGLAQEYTYYPTGRYLYRDEFKKAENQAREQKKGLWAEVCGGA